MRNNFNHSTPEENERPAAAKTPGDASTPDNAPGLLTGMAGGESASLRSRIFARVLLVTASSSGSMTEAAPSAQARTRAPHSPAFDMLTAAGHQVTRTTSQDWIMDLPVPDDDAPEVLVVEVSRDIEDLKAAMGLCRELKASTAGRDAALLVALPAPPRRTAKKDVADTFPADTRAAIAALREVGADDFCIAGGNADEAMDGLMARLDVMVQLARLRRELQMMRAHLRLQIQTDDLTRLLNKRFFFQAAHREYARARRHDLELSCLMLDVDGLRRFNARFGYQCGDAVLRAIAGVLRDSTRESDLVARFAEEKFVILLPETPIEGAIALREIVQRAVAACQFTWQGRALPLSVSVGESARRRAASPDAATLPAGDDEDEENEEDGNYNFQATDHSDGVPLSSREGLAGLLEEADAALFVARRGARLPALPDEAGDSAAGDAATGGSAAGDADENPAHPLS